jgi:hypothetical protein
MPKILIFIFLCVLDVKGYSQRTFTINLIEELDKLKPNVYFINFIPIDSIVNGEMKINENFEKELIKLRKSLRKDYYYSLKIGFHSVDSNRKQITLNAFTEVKKYLTLIKSKKVVKIDHNCENALSIYSEASEYEEVSQKPLSDTILITIYKSKRKIERLNHRKHCYF